MQRSIECHSNLLKRCLTIPRAVPYEDLNHSQDETRYAIIGMSSIGLLFVSFTYRDKVVRLIGPPTGKVDGKSL